MKNFGLTIAIFVFIFASSCNDSNPFAYGSEEDIEGYPITVLSPEGSPLINGALIQDKEVPIILDLHQNLTQLSVLGGDLLTTYIQGDFYSYEDTIISKDKVSLFLHPARYLEYTIPSFWQKTEKYKNAKTGELLKYSTSVVLELRGNYEVNYSETGDWWFYVRKGTENGTNPPLIILNGIAFSKDTTITNNFASPLNLQFIAGDLGQTKYSYTLDAVKFQQGAPIVHISNGGTCTNNISFSHDISQWQDWQATFINDSITITIKPKNKSMFK